jgi:cbb3-type cytochrome c oxidase subunit III
MTVFFCVACTVTETTNSNANHSANQNSAPTIVVTPAPPANANAPAAGENANAASKNSNAAGATSTASNIDAAALFNNETSPKCASCHQPDGKGKQGIKEIPNFTDAAWQKKTTDAEMIKTIKEGHKPMPAYKDKLSDDQIKALVAYVRKFAS